MVPGLERGPGTEGDELPAHGFSFVCVYERTLGKPARGGEAKAVVGDCHFPQSSISLYAEDYSATDR